MNSKRSLSFKLAFSGIICSLAVIVMFLSIVPGFTYALPAVSGILLWTIGEQINKKWGILSFAATCFLSLMLVPEPEAISFFIAFFGYYPLVREFLQGLKPFPLRITAKLLIFNITIVTAFQIVSRIIGIDRMIEGLEFFGDFAVYGLWGFSNIAFICYDFCLDQVFYVFRKWLKPKLSRRIK